MRVFSDMWAYLSDGANWAGSDGIAALLGQQLLLTFTALLMAMVVGLPIALWLGHLGRGGFLAINISNVGRAIPTFALLGLLVVAPWPGTDQLGPYGRAGLATLLALTLFALPHNEKGSHWSLLSFMPGYGIGGKHFHMVAAPTTVRCHHHGKARILYMALISPEGI